MYFQIGSYLSKICLVITIYSIRKGLGWSWKCENEMCVRSSHPNNFTDGSFQTLDLCRLTCGSYGSLWPRPTKVEKLGKKLLLIVPHRIRFFITETEIKEVNELQNEMCNILKEDLKKMCGETCATTGYTELFVKVLINSTETDLTWFTNESYLLEVTPPDLTSVMVAGIEAKNVYGARHGLQTLSQLMTVVSHPNTSYMMMNSEASITDSPVYPHRGLLIDTGRHFLSVETIKRTLDGMAYSKLNVLHWHATDSSSFPLKLPNVPEMAKYGAYSEEKTYSTDDIRELVSYGRKRGVRIIMEIDTPAHAGNGWQWGPKAGLGNLSLCVNQMPWRDYCDEAPCGTLNPVNPNTYNILQKIYKNLLDIFPKGEIIHMGGNELRPHCWNSTAEILDHLENRGLSRRESGSFLQLWFDFRNRTKHDLDSASGNQSPSIIWTSQMTTPWNVEDYVDRKKFVIQALTATPEEEIERLLNKGYQMIISTSDRWHLDRGFQETDSYSKWETVYDYKIPLPNRGVYGGEVCMWGQFADDSNIDAKIWPRAAAFAERVWSNPDDRTQAVRYRLLQQRRRLLQLGIKADAILQEWCKDNENWCPKRDITPRLPDTERIPPGWERKRVPLPDSLPY